MLRRRSFFEGPRSLMRIALFLSLSVTALAVPQVVDGAERGPLTIPEPKTILRDLLVTPPSTSITLDPSGRSGTISVSGGSEDNLVLNVAFSPDGRWLLGGRSQGQLDVWDTKSWTKALTIQGDEASVTALATSPDGHTVAAGGEDKTVKIWDISSGTLVAKVPKCKDYPDELAFSSDGQLLAVIVNGGPNFVYDVAKRKVVKKIPANGVAFSDMGDVMVTSLGRKITFWDTKSWKTTRELSDSTGHFSKIAVDLSRERVVAGAWQGETKIWDLSTGAAVASLNAGYIASLFVSHDGRWVFTGGDGFIKLWSARTGEQLCTSNELGLWDLNVTRDGRWMAAGVDNTIQIWSTDEVVGACEKAGQSSHS